MSYQNGPYQQQPQNYGYNQPAPQQGYAAPQQGYQQQNPAPQQGEEKKPHYTTAQFVRLPVVPPAESKPNDLIGLVAAITGYVNKVEFSTTTNQSGETVNRASVTVDACIPDSTVRYYLGDEFVTDRHYVRFRAYYYSYEEASIRRIGLKKNDTVQMCLYKMHTSIGTTGDGHGYAIIDGTSAGDLALIKRSGENNGQSQQNRARNAQPEQPSGNCSNCGAPVTDKVIEFSNRQYGRPLCRDCQSQFPKLNQQGQQKPNQGYAQPAQPQNGYAQPQQQGYAPAPQQGYAQPQNGYAQPAQNAGADGVCSQCGDGVDAKVVQFSTRNYGRVLCRNCQKNAPRIQQPNQGYAQPQNGGYAQPQNGATGMFDQPLNEGNPFYRG